MNIRKICPVCSGECELSDLICLACGSDISAAAPVQARPAGEIENGAATAASSAAAEFKICPGCGASNASYSMLCNNCGRDLSAAGETGPALILYSAEDGIEITIKGETVFGRCARCLTQDQRERSLCRNSREKFDFIDCERFNTVSRRHLIFKLENGVFYVKIHPDAKNPALLNSVRLTPDAECPLAAGDVLQVSSKLKLSVLIK
ncbi:MAG TPA: FHA domain-containing protein [Candidatus Wallbacteria bacterium]|nr:MAG: Double zinc ribbon [bacterium ADurb.Bin243]HOD43114.1 FHA domain-containing protein [Candidatus Wallbacteria bacterium]HPG57611.1 FHA domain-containing protein [Candidatus Wallbacteria bacterium]